MTESQSTTPHIHSEQSDATHAATHSGIKLSASAGCPEHLFSTDAVEFGRASAQG